jgi:transposase
MIETIIRKSFKYRLRPKAKQAALLRRYAGCCRKAWNLALAGTNPAGAMPGIPRL